MKRRRFQLWLRDCAALALDARDLIGGLPGVVLAVLRLWLKG